MTTTFPASAPSTLGIDPDGIAALVTALESTPDVEPHGFVLLRHGEVAAQGWWAPYEQDRVHLMYSLSKSLTAAAVGIAHGEGLIDLDATVLSYFPELDVDITDERSRRMRVRHVLAMASGHREETLERALAADPENIVRGFLMVPPDEEPGTVFAYNQPCTFTAASIVRRVSGGSLLEYLRPRLFAPLGIDDVAWKTDERGDELGWSGCYATTESIAKLGQLYLRRGVWGDTRILSEEWVDLATRPQVDNATDDTAVMAEEPDWHQGYGFQFWMARHGFRGDGAYGQFCVVLPEHDVVFAMTGQSPAMQSVLDAVWTHLLPAIDAVRPDAAEREASLAERLTTLGHPPVAGGALDDDAAGEYAARAEGTVTGLEALRLSRDASRGWTVTLGTGARTARVGEGSWAVDGALAGSAGTAADGSIELVVRYTDTPHALRLTLDPAARTFTAVWTTSPLHDTFDTLGRPAN